MDIHHVSLPGQSEDKEGFTFQSHVACTVVETLENLGFCVEHNVIPLNEAKNMFPLFFILMYSTADGKETSENYKSFECAENRQADLMFQEGVEATIEPCHRRSINLNNVLDLN